MSIICNSAPKVLKIDLLNYPSKNSNICMREIYFKIIVSESTHGFPLRKTTHFAEISDFELNIFRHRKPKG